MTQTGWIYFGCGSESGHYLFPEGCGQTRGFGRPVLEQLAHFDGMLAPLPKHDLYRAALSRLGNLGYSALSWWDCTVDKRPGSNSTIFAPSLRISADDLLAEGRKRFPWVFDRLPQPLIVIGQCEPVA